MPELPTISQITLPSGTTYNIKDAKAREDIAAIEQAISGGVTFMGETTTPLTDGATTSTIVINGNNVTALKGYLVVYESKEFVFDGTKWIEMGDLSALGDLAWKDSVSATYTPAGTVSQPTFTGTSFSSTGNFTPAGTITNTANSTSTGGLQVITSVSASIDGAPISGSDTASKFAIGLKFGGTPAEISVTGTPTGTVSQPTFTGSSLTSTGSFTPAGTISYTVDTSSSGGQAIVTSVTSTSDGSPLAGTNSTTANVVKTAFTGTSGSVSVTGTASGSVSAPTISVSSAGATTTVNSITDVGTLPSFSATVANENLTLGFSQGTLPTKGSDTTVKTGDASYEASAPTFTGGSITSTGDFTPTGEVKFRRYSSASAYTDYDGIKLSAVLTGGSNKYLHTTFTGTEGSVSVSGTPAGTVSQPTFTGDSLTSTSSTAYTPSGTIKFKRYTSSTASTDYNYIKLGTVLTDGTAEYLHSSFTGTEGSVSVSGTPTGTVSQPTFSGTQATITST